MLEEASTKIDRFFLFCFWLLFLSNNTLKFCIHNLRPQESFVHSGCHVPWLVSAFFRLSALH